MILVSFGPVLYLIVVYLISSIPWSGRATLRESGAKMLLQLLDQTTKLEDVVIVSGSPLR